MSWHSARADVAAPTIAEAPAELATIDPKLTQDEALKVRDAYIAKWKQLWGIAGGPAK